MTPSSWSGSRADAMQPRVDAIGELAHHERSDIASSAKRLLEELLAKIEGIRKREQQLDEAAEQRFE